MLVPRVFISSTCEDLRDYRQAARDVATGCGFLPVMMEDFSASPNPPLAECLTKVEEADLLVVIVAHCFGWVPDGQRVPKDNRKSITWLEFERAIATDKEVLVFLVNETYPWPAELREEHGLAEAAIADKLTPEMEQDIPWRVRRLQAFKREISTGRVIAKFSTPDTLQLQIAEALRVWRTRHPEFAAATPPASDAPCDPTAYLKRLHEDTGYIDIRGIQVGSGQATRFPIDELYIPLTTTSLDIDGPNRQIASKLTRPAEASATSLSHRGDYRSRHITLDQVLRKPRLVIIGDPGSGKTTFLKRIAHLLCRARLDAHEAPQVLERLGLDDPPFPLLLRIADLAEHMQAAFRQDQGPFRATSPSWLLHYLANEGREDRHGLNEPFLEELLGHGSAIVLLDGLDEAPTEAIRENVSELIHRAAQAYGRWRWVVTSRPAGYHGDVVLREFDQVYIDRLDDESIETFLRRWYAALFPDSVRGAGHHCDQVLQALRERPEIRLLARNPVMLTALGVVHWNEHRLPEQRAELYEAIIRWLSRARRRRPHRPRPETAVNYLQELALAMQVDPEGRQTQVNRHTAAESVAREHANRVDGDSVAWAEAFLDQEELDSGIVVRRGDHIRFWHLTFQEFLAARAMAARSDDEQAELLRSTWRGDGGLRIYQPEWREMVQLLAGVLHHHGPRRVGRMVATILDLLPKEAALTDQARCAALLGAVVQDLAPLKYEPADPRYRELLDAVFGLFDAERWAHVPIRVAIEAAEALGQAGDPRLSGSECEKNWVAIPAGEFRMGSQNDDPCRENFDSRMEEHEGPVHAVWLDSFRIGSYPVTVAEFARFVGHDGYLDQRWWRAGEFGYWSLPDKWDEQLQHPNRPVVYVSWFEAMAYAAWAGCQLPTEAEWERAARGTTGRRFAWGGETPNERRLNYASGIDWSNAKPIVGRATPVGIYPRGSTPDGICDMSGNVLEWCVDWYDPLYYQTSPRQNPRSERAGRSLVLRGGSWRHDWTGCRGACRHYLLPDARDGLVGFRVVRRP